MIIFLKNGEAINGQYYASELRQLNKAIKSENREKPKPGVFLFLDNALFPIATNFCFQLLPHPITPQI